MQNAHGNNSGNVKTSANRTGPLTDLRVIELGQLIAGPYCGQLLADMGADVIKVEPPVIGDPMRNWGRGSFPLWWSVCARNKRCITANLREKEGQDLIRRLVSQADIVLENFRPGTMERWGLSYESLSAENPGLIMVRVSGFGQTGPYAKRAGYAAIGEAMGGMRYLCGDPDRRPSRAGLSVGDSLAGAFACTGALAALQHRHKTGEGQVVDASIYESVLSIMEATISEYSVTGFVRERSGSVLPNVAPSNIYDTSDGILLIAANQDSVFKRLCTAMGKMELVEDERFSSHVARGKNQEVLDGLIDEWTRKHSTAHLMDLMEKHAVPAGPIYRAPEMLEDPHFQARNAIVDVPTERWPELKMQNIFPRMSKTQGEIRWPGVEEIGAHNSEIYGELLNLTDSDLEQLRQRNII